EGNGRQHGGAGYVGAPDAFQRQQRESSRDKQRRRHPRTRTHVSGRATLALEPCVEPASEAARGLDRPHGLQREHTAAHGGVVASATGAALEVVLKTA